MKFRHLALIAFSILSFGCTSLARDGAMIIAVNNYSDGDYKNTIDVVERALRHYDYTEEQKSNLLFLKALSYQNLGDYKSAYTLYKFIAYKYPNTEYGFRSVTIINDINKALNNSD